MMTHFKSMTWFVKVKTFLVILHCFYWLGMYELLSKIYLSYIFKGQIGYFFLRCFSILKVHFGNFKLYKIFHKQVLYFENIFFIIK